MTPSLSSSAVRVGIMGCSVFALRAMGPAAVRSPHIELIAIASRDANKAGNAAAELGCRALDSYEALIADPDIDAIYMPLPTGLHAEWVHKTLDAGKHLLVEKSLAANAEEAIRMVSNAKGKGLAILENFLFLRHSQIAWVREHLTDGTIGTWKYFRATFTIPRLDEGNFRYVRKLGGGALLDLGAYMSKSAEAFLGEEVRLTHAALDPLPGRDVDGGGTATYLGTNGEHAQMLWAFDTQYQCTWEFFGDKGRILCQRSLTPPPGFEPPVRIEIGVSLEEKTLPADDHYVNQWAHFAFLIHDISARDAELNACVRQAERIDAIRDFPQP